MNEANETAISLASIVESSHDAIMSKTLDGTILTWNAAAEKLFGYTAKEMIGGNINQIIPAALLSEELFIIGEIRQGRRVKRYETTRLRKGGEQLEVSLSISPIHGPGGEVVGASKIVQDLTEQKRTKPRRRRSKLAIFWHFKA